MRALNSLALGASAGALAFGALAAAPPASAADMAAPEGQYEQGPPSQYYAAPASRTSVASISVKGSTAEVTGGFSAFTFFRAFFAPRLSLASAGRFLGAVLAIFRFAVLTRADLGGLRTLRRAIDFPFRAVGRFFR
jgi:hypothetical protein